MKPKVGDLIRIKAPPEIGYNYILHKDWLLATGKCYRIAVLNGNGSAVLQGAPYSEAQSNGSAGHQWWWPANCIEIADRHPVEVF